MIVSETESSAREQHISARLHALRTRINAACEKVGRNPDDVKIVAVTKTYPASDVGVLAGLGVRDIGENRDQEAVAKVGECEDLDVRWHFVGQLQTNKARSVARYADVVHSVDRVRLASALGSRVRAADRMLTCLIQVNLDPGSTTGVLGPRGGVHPEDAMAVADAVVAEDGLLLGGVMAVAPREGDPARAFDRLYQVASSIQDRYAQATAISAGMSDDLEMAVEHGATHLRIGTALLSDRGPNVR